MFGGGAPCVGDATEGADAIGYGGGGGGGCSGDATNRAGGDGYKGIIIVDEYY